MAKYLGILRMRGSIDGVTYTEGVNGNRSRKRSSLDGEKMRANVNFTDVLKTQQELAMYAHFGKLLRDGVRADLKRIKAYRGVPRLNKFLNAIKALDTVHNKGERTVENGLNTAEGKQILTQFDYFGKTDVYSAMEAPFAIDDATGTLTISGLIPIEDLIVPDNATHVQFNSVVMSVGGAPDYCVARRSPKVYLPIDDTATDVVLTPTALPTGGAHLVYVLQILFYEEINGFKNLNGIDKCALTIVHVV